jgi:hypothetical protein
MDDTHITLQKERSCSDRIIGDVTRCVISKNPNGKYRRSKPSVEYQARWVYGIGGEAGRKVIRGFKRYVRYLEEIDVCD